METRTHSHVRKVYHLALAAWFVALLFLPLAGELMGWENRIATVENRNPAPIPELPRTYGDFLEFPDRFERFYNDHFGFRDFLITLFNSFKVLGLGVSSDKRVILGKEGWLFFVQEPLMETYRGTYQWQEAMLAAYVRNWEARAAWHEDRGIRYVVLLLPEKQTIYPEYMPDHVTATGPNTYLDTLLNYARSHSRLRIVSPKEAMLDAKKSHVLFYKHDTHWGPYGAFLGFKAVMDGVGDWFPQIPALQEEDFVYHKLGEGTGDLAVMLRLFQPFHEEVGQLWEQAYREALEEEKAGGPGAVPISARLPRMAMLGDSYGTNMLAMLPDALGEVLNLPHTEPFWQGYEKLAAGRRGPAHPELVIEEYVERNFFEAGMGGPPEVEEAQAVEPEREA